MITEEMIRAGYDAGVVTLIDAPNGGEVVCKIGDYWFYFWNGDPEQIISREVFLHKCGKEQIVHAIWLALEEFRELWSQFGPEYVYYETVLRKRLDQELSSEQKCLRELLRAALETEIATMFPSCHGDFPESFINDVVKDVFEFSAWQRKGEYCMEDIRSAIQRVVLAAVQARDTLPKL